MSAASCKATTALPRFYDLHFRGQLLSNLDIQGPVAVLDLLAAPVFNLAQVADFPDLLEFGWLAR